MKKGLYIALVVGTLRSVVYEQGRSCVHLVREEINLRNVSSVLRFMFCRENCGFSIAHWGTLVLIGELGWQLKLFYR